MIHQPAQQRMDSFVRSFGRNRKKSISENDSSVDERRKFLLRVITLAVSLFD